MPSAYKINDGETIFDVVMATYGSLEVTYKLLLENDQLESIDVELTTLPGISFTYDDAYKVPEVQGEKQIVVPPDSTIYPVFDGQSIYDIAHSVYGSLENIFELVQENIELIPSINQNLLGGMQLKFTPSLNKNLVFTKYLIKNDLVLNTSDPKVNSGSAFSFGFSGEAFY